VKLLVASLLPLSSPVKFAARATLQMSLMTDWQNVAVAEQFGEAAAGQTPRGTQQRLRDSGLRGTGRLLALYQTKSPSDGDS